MNVSNNTFINEKLIFFNVIKKSRTNLLFKIFVIFNVFICVYIFIQLFIYFLIFCDFESLQSRWYFFFIKNARTIFKKISFYLKIKNIL